MLVTINVDAHAHGRAVNYPRCTGRRHRLRVWGEELAPKAQARKPAATATQYQHLKRLAIFWENDFSIAADCGAVVKRTDRGGDIQMPAGLAEQAAAAAAGQEARWEAELEAEPVPPPLDTLDSMW